MKIHLPPNLHRRAARLGNNAKIALMARRVAQAAPPPQAGMRPVAFFKVSSGLDDFSWNSAFHLLTSWGLRLNGVPVAYFACHQGLRPCVLGTNRENPSQPPPCRSCVFQTKTLYSFADPAPTWFTFQPQAGLNVALQGTDLATLQDFTWDEIPLGQLVLPALRWILRRHHLLEDAPTLTLYRAYIASAFGVARQFEQFLEAVNPQVVLVFNGQFYPEATAKWVAKQRGVRVITHEVGFQPFSGYFTEGEATAYPISIPPHFALNDSQNARLDAYLENRFKGNFSMAGIKFWAEMKDLDKAFLQKASGFKQMVPIFTNVVFDTSQPHANTLFTEMFAWLDALLEVMQAHPETLFVLRAHPDEARPGKESRESVSDWVRARRAKALPNLVYIPPGEYVSSYALIARAKFVLIYNSTIGLEASILGAAVLSAGRARFTQYPTVFFPASAEEYLATLEAFLQAESVSAPPEFQLQARRFLYYQLYRTSLPFNSFLENGVLPVNARLKSFDPQTLKQSPAIQTVLKGLLAGGDFLLEE